jgi:hypothetical protein
MQENRAAGAKRCTPNKSRVVHPRWASCRPQTGRKRLVSQRHGPVT